MLTKKKKIIVISLLIVFALFVAMVMTFSYFQSRYYWELANKEGDNSKKLEYLIKSNFFNANNSKKIKIASIYIDKNRLDLAESYISSLRGGERDFYLSGFNAEKGVVKLAKASKVRQNDLEGEIEAYKTYLRTGETNLEGLGDSDYSEVIRYFEEGKKLTPKETYSYNYFLIQKTENEKGLNDTERRLLLAKRLLEAHQPNLAIKPISKIKEEMGAIKEALRLEVAVYKQNNDDEKAFEAAELAVLAYPEEEGLLKEALDLAKKLHDVKKVSYYQNRLNYLTSISR